MELLIIGFNTAIYLNYDAEAVGPLEGPLNDMFVPTPSKTVSPKMLQTVSVLSQ